MRYGKRQASWRVSDLCKLQQEPVPGVLAPGTAQLVEAGGQHFHGFRHGLDYAFIRTLRKSARMRSVLSDPPVRARILVPARGQTAVGGSMSLYRAGLKLALFLPLGVAMPPSTKAPSGFTDVSSVISQTSRPGATH
jgi:hypothetical protein